MKNSITPHKIYQKRNNFGIKNIRQRPEGGELGRDKKPQQAREVKEWRWV